MKSIFRCVNGYPIRKAPHLILVAQFLLITSLSRRACTQDDSSMKIPTILTGSAGLLGGPGNAQTCMNSVWSFVAIVYENGTTRIFRMVLGAA